MVWSRLAGIALHAMVSLYGMVTSALRMDLDRLRSSAVCPLSAALPLLPLFLSFFFFLLSLLLPRTHLGTLYFPNRFSHSLISSL